MMILLEMQSLSIRQLRAKNRGISFFTINMRAKK